MTGGACQELLWANNSRNSRSIQRPIDVSDAVQGLHVLRTGSQLPPARAVTLGVAELRVAFGQGAGMEARLEKAGHRFAVRGRSARETGLAAGWPHTSRQFSFSSHTRKPNMPGMHQMMANDTVQAMAGSMVDSSSLANG